MFSRIRSSINSTISYLSLGVKTACIIFFLPDRNLFHHEHFWILSSILLILRIFYQNFYPMSTKFLIERNGSVFGGKTQFLSLAKHSKKNYKSP